MRKPDLYEEEFCGLLARCDICQVITTRDIFRYHLEPAKEMRLQKTPWPRKSQNKKLFRYIVRQQNDCIRINDNLSFMRIFCLHTTIKIDVLFVPNEMSEQSLPYPQLKLMQQAFYRHWSSDQGVVWKPSTVEIVEQAGCQYSGPP